MLCIGMNSSSGDFDVKVVVANAAAVLVCLIAAVLVFTLNLHKKAVYRLALYQVMAACALGVVELLQIVMVRLQIIRKFTIERALPSRFSVCIRNG